MEKEVREAQRLKKPIIPCRHTRINWHQLKWGLDQIQGVEFNRPESLLRELDEYIQDEQKIEKQIMKTDDFKPSEDHKVDVSPGKQVSPSTNKDEDSKLPGPKPREDQRVDVDVSRSIFTRRLLIVILTVAVVVVGVAIFQMTKNQTRILMLVIIRWSILVIKLP